MPGDRQRRKCGRHDPKSRTRSYEHVESVEAPVRVRNEDDVRLEIPMMTNWLPMRSISTRKSFTSPGIQRRTSLHSPPPTTYTFSPISDNEQLLHRNEVVQVVRSHIQRHRGVGTSMSACGGKGVVTQ
ncbi:hypothetical protein Q1695_008420 [Nippostrongylus brasiliensis]|nr:hypothetical protein Q1695_008420 [Nippostrongylus brasiliensis]